MSPLLIVLMSIVGLWVYAVGAATYLRVLKIWKPEANFDKDGYVVLWPILIVIWLLYLILIKPMEWICNPIAGKKKVEELSEIEKMLGISYEKNKAKADQQLHDLREKAHRQRRWRNR